MTALQLLAELRAHGVMVRPENGGLELEAEREPPAELLEALKAHKAGLLSLLEPKRTITPPGCPEHWEHIPELPPKGEKVTPVDDHGNGLRYRCCLFGTWYILRFCPNVSPTHLEATAQDGKRYATPSMEILYRALWAEAYGDKALFYSATPVRA